MCVLQMKKISKAFYGVPVLQSVDFQLKKGQVHGLLGENGAGKSTLMNILGGVLPKDQGSLFFQGKEIKQLNPLTAQQLGIGFIHQELNLFNDLLVYENIFLRNEVLTKYRRLDKRKMVAQCRNLFEQMGVAIDPMASLYDLDAAEKQLVEIAKVLYKNAKIIIMDEPTTSLNQKEIEILFSIMKKLQAKGASFVYISHKIPEILHICDVYSVLRNGMLVGTGDISTVTGEELVSMMVGRSLMPEQHTLKAPAGLKKFAVKGLNGTQCSNISFCVQEGEIVAFTGLEGNGGSELMETLFGHRPMTAGIISIDGKIFHKMDIQTAMKQGIAFIPKNRKENGLIPHMDVMDNLMLSSYTFEQKKQKLHKKDHLLTFKRIREQLAIKVQQPTDAITSLSGGNQQKIIIGRWLQTGADIFLFDHPTQGIDVGAKEEVYNLIRQLAENGKSIIINTMEIPEIRKLANRCFVLYHGKFVKELSSKEITEENIMRYGTQSEGGGL